MALFEAGNFIESIECHTAAADLAAEQCSQLAFSSALALFSRSSQFQAPEDTLGALISLRHQAASLGNAQTLASMHVVVARLESLRGHYINAHRQVHISRQIAQSVDHIGLRAAIELVDCGLEISSGNLRRALVFARTGLDLANRAEIAGATAAVLGNLASISLFSGKPDRAQDYVKAALSTANELLVIKLSLFDVLSQAFLFDNNLSRCAELLDSWREVKDRNKTPARSWYDLDHQVTRCAYHERLGDWTTIIGICDEVDAEVARRQYKAIRTSLLCAKARALARLGEGARASQVVAAAVRACPRGAIDPQIVLEATKGTCTALTGDRGAAATHFDRAVAACRAIGHKYHEAWIARERQQMIDARASVAVPSRNLDTPQAALLLTDVAAALGAGHSIDLLTQHTLAILRSTPLGARVETADESGCEFQSEPSATAVTDADGTFMLQLRGSDRRTTIRVRGVKTIDEISLIASLSDVVRAAVNRTADTENEDDDQTLWPRAGVPQDEDVIFRSPRMIEILKIVARLASAQLPILITGETGTGKEIIARMLHDRSDVRKGPFAPFNCAATPRDLVESQLFGHRRGAFTGATESYQGLVRAAEHGTLFLDEIGELDPAIQPKLLRFLESGEVHTLGEARSQRVGVRVVSATNVDVEDMVKQGRFRADLYYRINGARISLPSLRERKDEIPALAALFLTRYSRECRRSGLRMTDDLVAALLLYEWPGNIRELANEIRRVVALAADGETLSAADLAPRILAAWNERPLTVSVPSVPTVQIRLDQSLSSAVDDLEQRFIDHALRASNGRVTDAAEMLGLSRKGLFLKRRRRGMVPRDMPASG